MFCNLRTILTFLISSSRFSLSTLDMTLLSPFRLGENLKAAAVDD